MHLPEGSVPKEGPSAGLAVAASLLSALLMQPVLPRVAMTGEITLTGQILAVGGLKEKILAARREGVERVILPEDVRGQVKELPAELLGRLELVYVRTFLQALQHILPDYTESELPESNTAPSSAGGKPEGDERPEEDTGRPARGRKRA
jgi:ATP-dependent Lon protease